MDTMDTEVAKDALAEALERRGWTWQPNASSWVFDPSRPTGTEAASCHFARTELDLCAGVVFPPAVLFICKLEERLDDVTGREKDWTTAAGATGRYGGHLAGTAPLQSIGVPEDDDELIALLEDIESWRWPDRLPADGFGGIDRRHGTLPADLPVLLAAVAERPGWEVYPSPVDGQLLCESIWPAFRFRTGAHIRPDTDESGYLAWAPDPFDVALRATTATEVAARLAEIEAW